MSYIATQSGYADSDLMQKLLSERKSAREFQERKHQDWNDNYELYRNKVKTNRLTQRQAVNIPLMKETEKTLLSRIDEPPHVTWKELSGDLQKQLYYQEIWNDQFRKEKFEWKDVVDKKNVLRYGLSTKKLNVIKTGVGVDVLDAWDVVYDPLMNPLDIETARFIVHQNIFRSLRTILASDRYNAEGKAKLKTYLSTKEGMVQSAKNREEWMKKMERLKAMGVDESDFPLFAGGDVIVNLCEHFTEVWDAKAKAFERRVVCYADDGIQLSDHSLEELIGVTFWPFVTWSEDPETNDIYPDSVDDLVRVPNKILNIWFSQMVENRTLRNFQMHWYDSTIQGYSPQTYMPGPGVMLPAPGDPNKTIMPVEISGLDETLNAMEYIIRVVERASGATAIEKGVGEKAKQTLGEVEILVGKATERAIGMAKFYRGSWEELCYKWDAMMQANPPKKMKLYKTGRNGSMYEKNLFAVDWKSEAGYRPIVSSSSEQEEEKTKGLQRMFVIKQQFPNNRALNRIIMKRELEILDLAPEELREIEDEEKQNEEMIKQQIEQGGVPGEGGPVNPQQALAQGIEQKVGALQGV